MNISGTLASPRLSSPVKTDRLVEQSANTLTDDVASLPTDNVVYGGDTKAASSEERLKEYAKGLECKHGLGYVEASEASVSHGVLEAGKSLKNDRLRSLVYDVAIETIAKGITSPTSVMLAQVAKHSVAHPELQSDEDRVAIGHGFFDQMREFDFNSSLPFLSEAGHYLTTGNFERYDNPGYTGNDDLNTPAHLGAAAVDAAMGRIAQGDNDYRGHIIAEMGLDLVAHPNVKSNDEKIEMGLRALEQVVNPGTSGDNFRNQEAILAVAAKKAVARMTKPQNKVAMIEKALSTISSGVEGEQDHALINFAREIINGDTLSNVKDRAQLAFACVESLAEHSEWYNVRSTAEQTIDAANSLITERAQLRVLSNFMENGYSKW